MRFPRVSRPFRRLAVLLGLALLVAVACVIPGPPVRGAGSIDLADVAALDTSAQVYRNVRAASLERHPIPGHAGYTLSFLEFDSDGNPGKGQVEHATASIAQHPDRDVVFVLFVHGWGHSAAPRDKHVVKFRETLATLASLPEDRPVVGIYVSWRAQWLRMPLHLLTYLDRTVVAQRLGGENCRVRKILGNLQKSVDARGREGDVAVAVGHSLGGQFLFSHMEECLDDDDDSEDKCPDDQIQCPPSSPEVLPLFGHLVLLINPAQDTNDFEDFRTFARDYPQSQPVVVILSSEADQVVGGVYRVGRTIRNIFWRKYWNDILGPETIGLGWNEDQVTHDLCSTKASSDDGSICARERQESALCCDYGGAKLWSRTDCASPGPVLLIRVDGRLVGGHGEIFEDDFAAFLRQFVAAGAQNPGAALPCPPG
jgi:hypothetical protein